MTYRIKGLDPAAFAPLFGLSEQELADFGAVRMPVTERPGFPCRISLDDALPGETVLLLNHTTVEKGPYEARHAIFVIQGADQAALFEDEIPPALDRRILSLRAFHRSDMMVDAMLVQPGEADQGIRRLFDQPSVAYIHAHNAIRGCFAAAVERAE
jgi:hypothetical protein